LPESRVFQPVRITVVQPKFAPLPRDITPVHRIPPTPSVIQRPFRPPLFQRAAQAPGLTARRPVHTPRFTPPAIQRRRSAGVIQRDPVPTGLAYGVSAGGKDLSLIHRVDPEEGSSPDKVRVYLTVFAYSDSGYKDIHAIGGGIKLIAKTADTMFNIGDPRRAFHYYNTSRAQTPAATCPIIRCFEIPKNLYDTATGQAISESQRAKLGRKNAYNVDKERGQNQFGVHASLRDEIERAGHNLVSYVEPDKMATLSTNPANGIVRDVNELRRHLGMPTEAVFF
jgi:hypothetical protein